MLEKTKVFLAVTAPDAARAQGMGLPCVCLYYRIGETGSLQRAQLQLSARGGLMGLYEAPGLALCQPEKLARDIQTECVRRGFGGVVVDFMPPPQETFQLESLCAALQRLQVRVYLPGELAHLGGRESMVIVPAAVSGGLFSEMVEALCDKYGIQRLCLDLVRCCQDFPMPAYDPDGRRMTARELAELQEKTGAQSFFSGDLCCKYFTYRQEDGAVHFVLFDDADTAHAKLEHIRRAGVGQVFLLYSEWAKEARELAGT